MGCGDSGGPVLAGAGPSFQGISPTPLPPPAPSDTYDPAKNYVIGVASLYDFNIGGNPATAYAPTYTFSASVWLAAKLTDNDGDGVINAWDAFPNCNDSGPDGDGDGTPDDCDVCPCDPVDTDSDGDGVCVQGCPGEPSENCPNAANPGQANCNSDSETVAGVTPVGDACDPVPCVRSDQTSQTSGTPLLQFTQTTYFDVEPIRVSSGPAFAGDWGHRFCDCSQADGTPDAPMLCSGLGCVISPTTPFDPDGPSWRHTRVGIDDPPQLNASFAHNFAPPAELQPGGEAATLERLFWDPLPNAPLGFTVTGSHWFHVKEETCLFGICLPSGIPQPTLDTLASRFWAGQAGQYVTIGTLPTIPEIFDWWIPPPPDCPMCGALEILPFAHLRPDTTLAIRTPAGDYSIEGQLTTAASLAMKTTTGVRWLAPSEPARLLHGAAIRLASIALDASEAGPALQSTPAGIDLVGAVCHCSPEPRSRFGAVLRATEGDLIVIGGILNGGGFAGDIWRYQIQSAVWTMVNTQVQILPGAVLAATYDADTRRLIVLDEVGTAPHINARLWSLEMESGAMQLLGSWARSGFFDEFALGHSHDGSFILLASKGQGVPLKVLRLLLSGDSVTLDKVRTSTGVPMTAPRTNQRGIHIVVSRPGKQIVSDRIDWSDLHSPGGKTLGDFVK